MTSTSRVTRLLRKINRGSNEAYDELFPLVYKELKRLAYSKLKQEHKDITYTETELVHEVYMKLADQDSLKATDKSHFMAIAARCMRQILIDHARTKQREKRGGKQQDVTYIDQLLKVHHQAEHLINLDEKLNELAQLNQRLADVVELRFFGKLTVYQTAQALNVSESTVKRDWAKARGWLYKELEGG
jgi:RNA polymerase sigma factor (TIGR02999 family)